MGPARFQNVTSIRFTFVVTVENPFSFYLAVVNAAVCISDFLVIRRAVYFYVGRYCCAFDIILCVHFFRLSRHFVSACIFVFLRLWMLRSTLSLRVLSRIEFKIILRRWKNYRIVFLSIPFFFLILSPKPSKQCRLDNFSIFAIGYPIPIRRRKRLTLLFAHKIESSRETIILKIRITKARKNNSDFEMLRLYVRNNFSYKKKPVRNHFFFFLV